MPHKHYSSTERIQRDQDTDGLVKGLFGEGRVADHMHTGHDYSFYDLEKVICNII